jgi:Homeodomain-like domain
MAWGAAIRIESDDADRSELEARTRRPKIAHVDAMRAEIVLLAATDMSNLGIAKRLAITRPTVGTWRKRFASFRLDASSMRRARVRRARSATRRSPKWNLLELCKRGCEAISRDRARSGVSICSVRWRQLELLQQFVRPQVGFRAIGRLRPRYGRRKTGQRDMLCARRR